MLAFVFVAFSVAFATWPLAAGVRAVDAGGGDAPRATGGRVAPEEKRPLHPRA